MSNKVREIENLPALVEKSFPVEPVNDGTKEVAEWLTEQASAVAAKIGTVDWYLLAHADDGVIWGRTASGNLITSEKAINDKHTALTPDDAARAEVEAALRTCATLRRATLRQARLFCKQAELLLWRDGDNFFHARLIRDSQANEKSDWDEGFDEPQMLWGTDYISLPDGFTLWCDGAQGLRHAVPSPPATNSKGASRPRGLIVRHYINKEGFASVVASRLVRFETDSERSKAQ